jgi:hypothetical protein
MKIIWISSASHVPAHLAEFKEKLAQLSQLDPSTPSVALHTVTTQHNKWVSGMKKYYCEKNFSMCFPFYTVHTVQHSVLLQGNMLVVLLTHHFTCGLCRPGQLPHRVPVTWPLRATPLIQHQTTRFCLVTMVPSTVPVLVAMGSFCSPLQRTVPFDCGTFRGGLLSSATEATPTQCGTLLLGTYGVWWGRGRGLLYTVRTNLGSFPGPLSWHFKVENRKKKTQCAMLKSRE